MKVAIIGAGNMGGAIARGLAQGTIIPASDVTVADPFSGSPGNSTGGLSGD